MSTFAVPVYSLGVLPHIADTESASRSLVSKVKPGEPGLAGAILRVVEAVRAITTRMPFGALKAS